MALIKCPECGREISDRAAACPHCGMPLGSTNVSQPAEKKIPVHIHWKRSMSTQYMASGTASVDGNIIGAINPGCDLETMLTPGNHVLTFSVGSRGIGNYASSANTENLNVPKDAKKVEVQIDTKMSGMMLMGAMGKVVIKDVNFIR